MGRRLTSHLFWRAYRYRVPIPPRDIPDRAAPSASETVGKGDGETVYL